MYTAIVNEHNYFKIILTNPDNYVKETANGVVNTKISDFPDSLRVYGELTITSDLLLNNKGEEIEKLKIKVVYNDKV